MPLQTGRQAWVDNLRTLMIVLVVNMHACVTYSHVGSWYLNETPEPPMRVKIGFLFWQGHLQAFFMGLLFFLAGLFAQGSLTRRGTGPFLRERFRRLGIPAVFYMLAIHPFMVYVLLGHPHVPNRPPLSQLYWNYITTDRVWNGNGPLWFALALLVFSIALVAVRALRSTPAGAATPQPSEVAAPGIVALLVFGAILIGATFLIRLVQPIGTNILNFQLCFFPQYIAAFAIGVTAGRQGWLQSLIASRRARVAGLLGLIGGPILLAVVLALGGPPPDKGPMPYRGGWTMPAFGLAAWEQATGLCLALGLMALFSKRFNRAGLVSTWLADRSFAVYVLHAPVLVLLTPLFRSWPIGPFGHAAVLTIIGLGASYLLADLVRRIPGVRSIL